MQDVATQLYKSGEIDLTQLFMLQNAGIPLGKIGPNGEFIQLSAAEHESYRNTPIDFIHAAKEAIAGNEHQGRASDPKSGYGSWKDILAVLQNRQGQVAGIDVMA